MEKEKQHFSYLTWKTAKLDTIWNHAELQKLVMQKYLKRVDNNLISWKKYGFRPVYSCINQILSITYTFTSSDNDLEVRGVSLNKPKALNKVGHNGLLYKLKQNNAKQVAMSFNRVFEKSPTKSSSKWSVLIMEKGECRHSTGINFVTFSVFDLHKGLAKLFTV